jgi:cyclohexanecarboxylate-CoA ligase
MPAIVSVSERTKETAAAAPTRVAVFSGGEQVSYDAFNTHVDRIATWLSSAGIGLGDVVTFWLPPGLAASVIFIATQRIGAVAHPMSSNLGTAEARQMLTRVSPTAVVVSHGASLATESMAKLAKEALPHCQIAEIESHTLALTPSLASFSNSSPTRIRPHGLDRASVIIFTSGTTGEPRAIVHSVRSIETTARDLIARLAITTSDVIGLASPIGHVRWVLYGGLVPFLSGGGLFVTDKWMPSDWVSAANAVHCTFGIFSPKHLNDLRLLSTKGLRAESVRRATCGGSYLSPRLMEVSENELDIKIVRGYGSTEFPYAFTGSFEDTPGKRWHYDGLPLGDTEMALRQDIVADSVALLDGAPLGRIQIRGNHCAKGQLNEKGGLDPIVDDGGWVLTEDTGELTDGYLRVTGRTADLIIRNGENINANELEAVLIRHPRVTDIAIVGARDEVIGERVCAVVVGDGLKPDLTVDVLATFLRESGIMKQKWPEKVIAVDVVPRTSGGKIRRAQLWKLVNGE